MTSPQESRAASEAAGSITDVDVRIENAKAINSTRYLIVGGMLVIFAVTVVGACLRGFFGSSARWGQMS